MHLTQCKQCVLVPQVYKLECGITSASWSQIKKKKKRNGGGRREGRGPHHIKKSFCGKHSLLMFPIHVPCKAQDHTKYA